MRRPFGLSFPIRIETARSYVQFLAVGPVAAVLPAAEDVAKAQVRGIAGLAEMESAERHKHRESVEDQLAVYFQTLAFAFRPMPSELLVAQC